MSHLEVKIVDKHGRVVPIDEPGELLVRGHSTFIGIFYFEKLKTYQK